MGDISRLERIRIVLSRTSHAGNLGSAARAMKTMGLSRLYLVNPQANIDETANSLASNATEVLRGAHIAEDLDSGLTGCVLVIGMSARVRDLTVPVLEIRDVAALMLQQAAYGDVALLFGNETNGLSNDELMHCQYAGVIAANPDYSSLNLAAAVQVAAYELRQAAISTVVELPLKGTPARYEALAGFFQHLEELMLLSGFLQPDRPGRLMQRIRRLFARTQLEQEEVAILRGILTALDPRRSRIRQNQGNYYHKGPSRATDK